MRTLSAPLVLLTVALALLPTSVPAQDEASLLEQAQSVSRQLQQMQRTLVEQEKLLLRRLKILEELTDGARTLAKSAPETGRSAAVQSVENARRIAEEEPSLPDDVFLALDRCEVEIGRTAMGEGGALAADRFLNEILDLERSTSEAIESFVSAAQGISGAFAQGGSSGERAAARGIQALEQLFAIHRLALEVRERGR